MPTSEAAATVAVAREYQAAVRTLAGRLTAILVGLWRAVPPAAVGQVWGQQLPQAVGAFTVAQQVAAGMADGYTRTVLAAQGLDPAPAGAVDPGAFAGTGASGFPLEDLLSIPAQAVESAVGAGAPIGAAASSGEGLLSRYAHTETGDAGRLSTQSALTARRVGGYVRVVTPGCCARCAILAGRWYRYNASFLRHPGCSCQGVPAGSEDGAVAEGFVTDAKALFDEGKVSGLSQAESQAIALGADPAQVVNARDGMYAAGGRSYTSSGTTRRGVAGARILARSMAEAKGAPLAVYRNFAVDRLTLARFQAQYGPIMRRGMPFQRLTDTGVTTAAYGRTSTARLTVAQIFRDAKSQEAAINELISNGYLL